MEEIWQRIVSLEGQTFYLKQGKSFTFYVNDKNEIIINEVTPRPINYNLLKKTYELGYKANLQEYQTYNISYVHALLIDKRVQAWADGNSHDSKLLLDKEILDESYKKFKEFISLKDGYSYQGFHHSNFIDLEEKYKEEIHNKARETVTQARWKEIDIGSGRIKETIHKAIQTKVIYKFEERENNLINNWRIKDDFQKIKVSDRLERLLFDLFKQNKDSNKEVFEGLLAFGLPYHLIAYLFFIKDRHSFLPISQKKFDGLFEDLGIKGFRTSNNATWDNYTAYLDIIKQVRDFLKEYEEKISLLDAHSYLWILGNQASEYIPVLISRDILKEELEVSSLASEFPEFLPEEYENAYQEGREILVTHKKRERNIEVVKKAKREYYLKCPSLDCQVCGFSYVSTYGYYYIEAHHIQPLSEIQGETFTKVEDLALVCSNCHVMLHRNNEVGTMEDLQNLIIKLRKQNNQKESPE